MVLFFTSMFPAASLYHLPCQTVSGMWCHVPAVGRARSALRPRRAGRTGTTGSCPRTRPPGNAAPHRAEARTQTRPVFRSSPRWPRAPSGMPPSSPEGQPGPAPAAAAAGPDPALPAGGAPTGAAGPRGPGRHWPCAPLLLRGGPWTVLSGPKASRTTGKREAVTPSKDSLFQREGGPARELPAPTQAVQVGAPVHGRLPSHARCRLQSRVSDSRWLKRPRQVAVIPNDDRPSWVRRPASFDPDPDALSAHRSALATPPPPVLPRWQRPPIYVLPHSHQTTACGLGWQNTADPTSVTGSPPPAVPGGLGVLGPGVESPPATALSREAGWQGSRGGHWAVRYSH